MEWTSIDQLTSSTSQPQQNNNVPRCLAWPRRLIVQSSSMDTPQTTVTMPPEPSGGSYKRSCIRCNQRKVGCDRNLPCGRCLKAGADCVHPTGKRAPRRFNRPPISEIRSHLVELEREVERLRSASRADQQPGSGTSTSTGDISNGEEAGTPKGKLMGSDGRTWYLGDEASVALADKV